LRITPREFVEELKSPVRAIAGNDDWPFPIPLVNKAGERQFDTKAGLDEILRRRISRNELSAVWFLSPICRRRTNMLRSIPPGWVPKS
jgi:hypothetical protein